MLLAILFLFGENRTIVGEGEHPVLKTVIHNGALRSQSNNNIKGINLLHTIDRCIVVKRYMVPNALSSCFMK